MIHRAFNFAQAGMYSFWLMAQAGEYCRVNRMSLLGCLAESSIAVFFAIGAILCMVAFGTVVNEMSLPHQGWTIEYTYGGSWIVRNKHGDEIAGGMSEQDARHDAKRYAASIGLPEQQLLRIKHDWE